MPHVDRRKVIVDKFAKSVEIARALWNDDHSMRCRHYSLIWHKDRIVSIGENTIKTHPVNLINGKIPTKGTCSEYVAINKLRNKTNIFTDKCILINVRLGAYKQLMLSKPCIACTNLLKFFQFKQVFFSTDNQNFLAF